MQTLSEVTQPGDLLLPKVEDIAALVAAIGASQNTCFLQQFVLGNSSSCCCKRTLTTSKGVTINDVMIEPEHALIILSVSVISLVFVCVDEVGGGVDGDFDGNK